MEFETPEHRTGPSPPHFLENDMITRITEEVGKPTTFERLEDAPRPFNVQVAYYLAAVITDLSEEEAKRDAAENQPAEARPLDGLWASFHFKLMPSVKGEKPFTYAPLKPWAPAEGTSEERMRNLLVLIYETATYRDNETVTLTKDVWDKVRDFVKGK